MAGDGRHNADAALVAALLGGATLTDAAQLAGMSERTARRRRGEKEFTDRLEAAGRDVVETAGRALTAATAEAVATLRDLLHDGPPAVRHNAARTILEAAVKVRRENALEERVAALERSEAERQKGG